MTSTRLEGQCERKENKTQAARNWGPIDAIYYVACEAVDSQAALVGFAVGN